MNREITAYTRSFLGTWLHQCFFLGLRTSVRFLVRIDGAWKQRDFPAPVGATRKTSRFARRALRASSCLKSQSFAYWPCPFWDSKFGLHITRLLRSGLPSYIFLTQLKAQQLRPVWDAWFLRKELTPKTSSQIWRSCLLHWFVFGTSAWGFEGPKDCNSWGVKTAVESRHLPETTNNYSVIVESHDTHKLYSY